jgi:hypothetical protein
MKVRGLCIVGLAVVGTHKESVTKKSSIVRIP